MLKPAQHLAAGEVLRALDLSFDFGFMLLEPYSTLDSTLANVDFLVCIGEKAPPSPKGRDRRIVIGYAYRSHARPKGKGCAKDAPM